MLKVIQLLSGAAKLRAQAGRQEAAGLPRPSLSSTDGSVANVLPRVLVCGRARWKSVAWESMGVLDLPSHTANTSSAGSEPLFKKCLHPEPPG